MMRGARFILTSNRKKFLWNSEEPIRLPLPLRSELYAVKDRAYVRDIPTEKVLSEFCLTDVITNTLTFIPGTQVRILPIQSIPSADEDVTRKKSPQMTFSGGQSLFGYEGKNGKLLDFYPIKGRREMDAFTLRVEKGRLSIVPRIPNLILKNTNGRVFSLPEKKTSSLDFSTLSTAELSDGVRWWKFSAFLDPILLDESEFEMIDAQEADHDRLFRALFGAGVVFALAILFTTSVGRVKSIDSRATVVATADLKIDRSLIDEAAPLLGSPNAPKVIPSPLALVTPIPEVVPSPVARSEPKPAPTISVTSIKGNPKSETSPIAKTADYHSSGEPPVNRSPAGNKIAKKADALSSSEQILSRHSKLLQAAFGGILHSNGNSNANSIGKGEGVEKAGHPAGNEVSTQSSNSNVSGAGFFSNGFGRSPAQSVGGGIGNSGGVANQIIQRSEKNLDGIAGADSVGVRAGKGGEDYGSANTQISLSGQGNGIAFAGEGMIHSEGRMSASVISAVFRQNSRELRNCYEIALVTHPDAQGSLTLAFGISRDGSVSNSKVSQSSIQDKDGKPLKLPELLACLTKRLSSWKFPKPTDGNPVEVSAYPIELKSVGGT